MIFCVSVLIEARKGKISYLACTFQVLLFRNVKMSLINITKYRNAAVIYTPYLCLSKSHFKTWILIGWKKVTQLSHRPSQSPKIDVGDWERAELEGEGLSSSYCLQIWSLIALMGVKTNFSTPGIVRGFLNYFWYSWFYKVKAALFGVV